MIGGSPGISRTPGGILSRVVPCHRGEMTPSSPSLPLFTRHEHRGNKTLNWDLTPSREILIVGASYIARLPLVRDSHVQVDSFPGTNLSQAATLIRNKRQLHLGFRRWCCRSG
ncbi:hypothetical protein KUCAC02_000155 [Chaenocephalus aceratus]|uniref:Uncharacterized protein n=1 Tax=Chaenocephalus aceratus TaxID=36190 RepID=A0ACB9W5I9_CHAAC|nr:hypothetical protein KUCAC02_000155 [Chaenocephalus aceratus]